MEDGTYQINSRTQGKMASSGFRSQEVDMYRADGDEEMRAEFSEGIVEQNAAYHEIQQSSQHFKQVTHKRTETFQVNMGVSHEEMNGHLSKCNIDFKENIVKKASTIKL